MRVGFCDDFHINEKNFASLYAYFREANIQPSVLIGRSDPTFPLIRAEGDYKEIDPFIAEALKEVSQWSPDEFSVRTEFGIRVFGVARGEILGKCLAKQHWQQNAVSNSDAEIIRHLWEFDRSHLIMGCAATISWLRHWHGRRKEIFEFDYIVSFSGSLIYSRSLIQLLRYSKVKSLLIESFFTGNDYYLDESYEPLPNNPLIKRDNIWLMYSRQYNAQSEDVRDRDALKATNKVLNPANKNVVQPLTESPVPLPDGRTLLVALQVVNDFSIIDGGHPILCTVPFYKSLIKAVLNGTDFNIIVKCHPWERKKKNVESPVTLTLLQEFIASLDPVTASRVFVCEDHNLRSLIQRSDAFFTICSQSAIEAALFGLRPIVFGSAFYAKRGFTTEIKSIEDIVATLKRRESLSLDMGSYRAFLQYIGPLMEHYLISCFPSGLKRIKDRLTRYSKIPLEKIAQSEMSLAGISEVTIEARASYFGRNELANPAACRSLGKSTKASVTACNVRDDGNAIINVTLLNNSGLVISPEQLGTRLHVSYRVFEPDGTLKIKAGSKVQIKNEFSGRLDCELPLLRRHLEIAGGQLRFGLVFEGIRWVMFPEKYSFRVGESAIELFPDSNQRL